MELREINNLVELFYKKYEEIISDDIKKTHEEIFLVSLKNKDFADTHSGPFTYSWGNINTKIKILSNYLEKEVVRSTLLKKKLQQTPHTNISPKVKDTWKTWSFR